MKSTTGLAATMLAAAMLAGCVSSTAEERTRPAPVGDGYAPERTAVELKASVGTDISFKRENAAPPRSNVRADDLHALFADKVFVGYWSASSFRQGKRALKLNVEVNGGDGHAHRCVMAIRGLYDSHAWGPATASGPKGQVFPILQGGMFRVRMNKAVSPKAEGAMWGAIPLYDPVTGEVVLFNFSEYRIKRGEVHAYPGHLQERLPRAVYDMCPNFPPPERLGLEVNEAQTAQFYDDLLAQDPGRRVLRPDLVTPHEEIVAEYRKAPYDLVRSTKARLEGSKGRAIRDAGANRNPVVVYYAPLSAIWILDARDFASAANAKVRKAGTAIWHVGGWGGHVRLDWNDGESEKRSWPLPELEFAKSRHPLAVKHDRLLGGALAREVAGLPAGSRFAADGTVRHADGSDRSATWRSHGDRIEIVRSGRSDTMVPLDDVVAALGG